MPNVLTVSGPASLASLFANIRGGLPQLPGLSSNVVGSGYAGLNLPSTSATDSTWFIYQQPTTNASALQSNLYLQRNTSSFTGGTTLTVPAPLTIINFSGRNDISWNSNIASTLYNKTLGSLGSQDAAGLFFAVKQNSTGGGEVGFTWGINAYCWDQQPTVNPVYTSIGAEIDVYVSSGGGTDTGAGRAGLNVVGGVPNATDAAVHIGTGIQISTVGSATIDRGLSYFTGTFGTLITTRGGTVTATAGINWTSCTFSGNAIATPGFTLDGLGNLAALGGTLGSSITQTISVYGAARVAQRAAGNNAVIPAGGAGTAAGGWDTAAHRDAAIATMNEMRTTLVNFGLMPST